MTIYEDIRLRARVFGYISYAKGIYIPNPYFNDEARLAWATGYHEGADSARYEASGADNDNWRITPDQMERALKAM